MKQIRLSPRGGIVLLALAMITLAVLSLAEGTWATNTFTGTRTIPTRTPRPSKTPKPTKTPKATKTPTLTRTPTNTPVAGQGCTPGYWKQSQHFDSWTPTGYTTGQLLNTVFSNTGSLGTSTLLDALSFNGGPTLDDAKELLLRSGVAALLNAAHPSVSYPLTTSDVISQVSSTLTSTSRATILAKHTELDGYNNLGCPLN